MSFDPRGPAGPAWTPASACESSADWSGGPTLPPSQGAYSVPEGGP